jgi:hypothetical protein
MKLNRLFATIVCFVGGFAITSAAMACAADPNKQNKTCKGGCPTVKCKDKFGKEYDCQADCVMLKQVPLPGTNDWQADCGCVHPQTRKPL